MSMRLVASIFAVTFGAGMIVPAMLAHGSGNGADQNVAMTDTATPQVAAAPALPPAGPYGTTAELRRENDGHFWANATLNGQSVRMLVDSGATVIALNESDARRLGIRFGPKDFTGRVSTANGMVEVAPVRIASVRIGNVERIDIPAAVLRGNTLPVPLLGQSFMSALAEVQIRGDVMTIT